MSERQWAEVESFTADLLVGEDEALQAALTRSASAGLPAIAVSPNQGKLLQQLVRLRRASRVLELGALGGYSTIWLARGLEGDGSVLTLEVNADFAKVARENIDNAGVGAAVEVRVGPAEQSMRALIDGGEGPFDFVFIDADKANTPTYFELALKLTEPGAVILVDNVVRGGTLLDEQSADPGSAGMREFLRRAAKEPRVSASTIQTVGSKGWDGFTLALVEAA